MRAPFSFDDTSSGTGGDGVNAPPADQTAPYPQGPPQLAPQEAPSLKFNPDLSFNPPAYLAPPQTLAPLSKLKLTIANAKARQAQEKRDQDAATQPIVFEDISANIKAKEDQMQALHAHINDLNQRMATPPPVQQAAHLGMPELISSTLAMILGGRADHVLGSAYANVEDHNKLDFENKMRAFGVDHENVARMLQQYLNEQAGLQHEIDVQGDRQYLHTEHVADRAADEAFDLKKLDISQAFQRADHALQRFKTADNEGEVMQAADELNGLADAGKLDPSYRVSPEAKAYAVSAAKAKGRDSAIRQYGLIHDQIQFSRGRWKPGEAEALQRQVDELNHRYDVNLPPVPTTESYKAQNDAANRSFREEVEGAKRADIDKRYTSLTAAERAEVAHWKAEEQIARESGGDRKQANKAVEAGYNAAVARRRSYREKLTALTAAKDEAVKAYAELPSHDSAGAQARAASELVKAQAANHENESILEEYRQARKALAPTAPGHRPQPKRTSGGNSYVIEGG